MTLASTIACAVALLSQNGALGRVEVSFANSPVPSASSVGVTDDTDGTEDHDDEAEKERDKLLKAAREKKKAETQELILAKKEKLLAEERERERQSTRKRENEQRVAKDASWNRNGSFRIGFGTPKHDSYLSDENPLNIAYAVEDGFYGAIEIENGDPDGISTLFGISATDATFTNPGAGVIHDLTIMEIYFGVRLGKVISEPIRLYGDFGLSLPIAEVELANDNHPSETAVTAGIYYGVGVEFRASEDITFWLDYRALAGADAEFPDTYVTAYETQSLDYSRVAFGIGFSN